MYLHIFPRVTVGNKGMTVPHVACPCGIQNEKENELINLTKIAILSFFCRALRVTPSYHFLQCCPPLILQFSGRGVCGKQIDFSIDLIFSRAL